MRLLKRVVGGSRLRGNEELVGEFIAVLIGESFNAAIFAKSY